MSTLAIGILALTGLAISSYFTAIAYRWVRPDAGWIPAFCRLGEDSCSAIVFTPRARVFGVPNSVLGQFYYLALMGGVSTGFVDIAPWRYGYLAGAALTVLLGIYLTYSLLFVTRVRCVLCFTSHALNLVLMVLLVLR